jgi:hypothetical protein
MRAEIATPQVRPDSSNGSWTDIAIRELGGEIYLPTGSFSMGYDQRHVISKQAVVTCSSSFWRL